jgi:hypothetical protein
LKQRNSCQKSALDLVVLGRVSVVIDVFGVGGDQVNLQRHSYVTTRFFWNLWPNPQPFAM